MLAAVGYPFTKILSNMGRNSQNSNSKAEFDAMWAYLKTLTNDTAKPIIQTTIVPTSSLSSTSGGTTLAGQSADSGTYRDGLNAYIKSMPAGIAGYIDVNLAVENASGTKSKWPVPGFTAALSQAANVGDTTLFMNAAPAPGDFLAVGVGSSNNENVFVNTVTGSGPYAVTIQNAGQYTGGLATARASGAAVGGQGTIDGTHPSTQVYVNVISPAVVAGKSNGVLTGTTVAVPIPTVTLSAAQSKSEGNSGTTAYTYTVTRSISDGAISVAWTLTNGTTDSTDFDPSQATSGTVAFAAGATTGTFTILVAGDTAVEQDETFTVAISAPSGYNAGASMSATGTVLNDDGAAPTPTVTISEAQSKSEGNSGTTSFTYTVTRSATSGAASVPWSLGYGNANAADFDANQATSGSVALADGVASGTITILAKGDTDVEPDETFTVAITAPSGYASGSAMTATGTIVNDDASGSPALPTANQIFHYDYSNMSGAYQDSARTTPVTADGQPVQSFTDTGSAGAHTTGTAVYRTGVANGKGGVQFNGTSDVLQSNAAGISAAFTGSNIPFVLYEVQKITAAPAATSAPLALVGTGFYRTSLSTSNGYSVGKRNNSGSAASVITDTAASPAVGDTVVWAYRHNGNGTADIFKNGTLVKSGTTPADPTSVSRVTSGASVATGGSTPERFWPGIKLEDAGYAGTYTNDDVIANSAILKSRYGIA